LPATTIEEALMNTAELAKQLTGTHKLTETQAKHIINKILKIIVAAATEGQEVALPGFGKFKVIDRPARAGRNPATGAAIDIPASKKLVYASAKAIKDSLNAAP
jgi:DNA-binding protein HU-beta